MADKLHEDPDTVTGRNLFFLITHYYSIKSCFLQARPVLLDEWLVLFETDFLPSVVVVPQSALCCTMFLVSDTDVPLWRSQRGQWGYDRFTHHHDDHCICGRLVCLSAVRQKQTESVYCCHSPCISRCVHFFVSALSSVVPKTACHKIRKSVSETGSV